MLKNMIKPFITMFLTALASSAVANVDPVVSEYQKIDALQKNSAIFG